MEKAASERCLPPYKYFGEQLDKHLVRWTAVALPLLSEISANSSGDPLYQAAGVLHRRRHRVRNLFRGVFHRVHGASYHLVGTDDLQACPIEDVVDRALDASDSRVRRRGNRRCVVEDQFYLGGR